MQTWFLKSLLATVTIVPSFVAIPFFKHRYGLDPLVFVVWYFGGTCQRAGSLGASRIQTIRPAMISIGIRMKYIAKPFLFVGIIAQLIACIRAPPQPALRRVQPHRQSSSIATCAPATAVAPEGS